MPAGGMVNAKGTSATTHHTSLTTLSILLNVRREIIAGKGGDMARSKMKPIVFVLLAIGSLFGIWAASALIGGLRQADWQPVELIRQCLVASGMIQPIHTLVDFYTHIKGIEYLICIMFFVAFPIFYQYVDHRKEMESPLYETGDEKKESV